MAHLADCARLAVCQPPDYDCLLPLAAAQASVICWSADTSAEVITEFLAGLIFGAEKILKSPSILL